MMGTGPKAETEHLPDGYALLESCPLNATSYAVVGLVLHLLPAPPNVFEIFLYVRVYRKPDFATDTLRLVKRNERIVSPAVR